MKIINDKQKFRKFQISIETEDEALTLWHALNMSDVDLDEHIKKINSPACRSPSAINMYAMWRPLNDYLKVIGLRSVST